MCKKLSLGVRSELNKNGVHASETSKESCLIASETSGLGFRREIVLRERSERGSQIALRTTPLDFGLRALRLRSVGQK